MTRILVDLSSITYLETVSLTTTADAGRNIASILTVKKIFTFMMKLRILFGKSEEKQYRHFVVQHVTITFESYSDDHTHDIGCRMT